MVRIAVVAPSCTLSRLAAERVHAIAEARGDCELTIHQQCFLNEGHFAGTDQQRLSAFAEVMSDPDIDAVWFARGGYGSNRIAEAAAKDLPDAARAKLIMGYSDGGFLLAALHRVGLQAVHGPMAQDVLREDGDAAINRALDWIVRRDRSALEPHAQAPAFAFNLVVLSAMIGTVLEPDLRDADLMIEEVSEHHYRIDRLMFHVTSSPNVRRVARIRLGRVADVPPNEVEFGSDESAIVEHWCARSGIAFGGLADLGHDSMNKVVPFGLGAS